MIDIKKIETLLHNKKIKSTAMRNVVLQYFLNTEKAISLKDLETEFHYSDRTTLFRTIKTFKEKGLLHAIKDGSNSTKYALCHKNCTSENHIDIHPHFYCVQCKNTICLRKVSIPTINIGSNFIIQSTELIVKGICDNCNTVA